jgi:PAS domain S-box-containing protein
MQLAMSKKNSITKVPGLQQLMKLSGTLVILTGAITLLGWITSIQFLINFMPDYVPMAVPNCIFFMIYGVIFISGDELFKKKINKVIVLSVIGLCSLYGFLQFVGNLVNLDLNFDFTLFPVREKLGNFPIGHMSPYSGLLFLMSGTAILLKTLTRERASIRNITGGLGIIIVFAGFIAGLGYLFGTPFLYSGNVIPLSLRTAISFIFLGFGLLFMAGENTVFLKQLIGTTPDARLLIILITIIISVFLFEGVLNVIFTHYYKINEALILAFLTIFSVILCIIVIINLSKVIFQSANIAEQERYKAVEELKKANTLQTLVLENSTLGICMVRNQEFQWNNSRFSEVFQLTTKDLKGYSTRAILNPDEVFENRTSWLDIMKTDKIVDKTIQLQRSNGDLFWCRFLGTPLNPVNPNEGSVWMVEDITERKKLREKMRLLSHTIENMAECVSITDIADRIIFVNKAFENIYGYKQEELIDKNISIVSSPNNDAQLINSILPATLNGGWKGEVINRRKDGTEFPAYMATSKVVDENGEVVALVGVATNITERKQTEQQLEKYSEDMKRANDAKDKLFSIISHDLRSPFNSILGFFNLLSEQYDDISEDERKSFILDLKKSSENTFVLLENLLTWSQTQTGGIKVNAIHFDLAEVVDQQFEVLKNAANSKSINLINQVSHEINVYADKDMVKTILINLTNNSIKFTRPGGIITVNASIKNNDVEITVEDNGVGIESSVLENMFKLEKSQSTLGTSQEKGTGLGLLICKEFTERNNGKIWVQSESGNGSTFFFTLPLYSKNA